MADEAALLEDVFDDDTTASAAAAGSTSTSTPKVSSGNGATSGVDEDPKPVLAPAISQNSISKSEATTTTADTPPEKSEGQRLQEAHGEFYQKESRR